jgi:hypothetical protein
VGLARLADVMLLLLVPQMGDEVRVFKAIVRTVATEVNEPYSVADEILKQAGYIEARD